MWRELKLSLDYVAWLAKALDIPWSPLTRSLSPSTPEEGVRGWAWDGDTLHGLDHRGVSWEPHSLLHEIGHFLCASPQDRLLNTFNCTTYAEESAASIIGEVLRHSSGDTAGVLPTLVGTEDTTALSRARVLLESVGIVWEYQTTLYVRRLRRFEP